MTSRSDWSKTKVFVSGASGMIGSWLCKELLSRGAHITALVIPEDRSESELYRSGDIDKLDVVNGTLEDFDTVKKVIKASKSQCVFHLGAVTIVGDAFNSPLQTLETNIRGTYNVLEACRLNNTLVDRIVIASSDKAYGHHEILPYTENMRLNGQYPYEISKTCADLIAQAYHTTYGLPVGIARCGNVFGGGDLNWSRIVPSCVKSFIKGERPIIRSDGTYIRDYMYVKDTANAYISLANALDRGEITGQAFNFGTESPVSVIDLFREIQNLMGLSDVEPEILSVTNGEIHSQYLSCEKARRMLGWIPKYDRLGGLTETIKWYREFLSYGV